MKNFYLIIILILSGFRGCSQNPGPTRMSTDMIKDMGALRAVEKHAPLRNFFGVNAFEWDFEDGANPAVPDSLRLSAIKGFAAIRHYLDWEKLEPEEGSFSYNPARSGGWNYDTIYTWCKEQGIFVLPCLKTLPGWMQASYPEDQRDAENVPARYGSDLKDPAAYVEQAKVAFQFAARYGSNKNADKRLLTVNSTPRWTNDGINEVKTGLGLIKYIECDNERDKWWKGRKAYQTGREYAANLSAFYDGNKGKLGPGAGVKNADPSMMVVMAGLASPGTDYIKGMIDWSRENRGVRRDGSVDLPWDIINYHYYANDADMAPGKEQTMGVAPEISRDAVIADNFVLFAHQFAHDMPVWVTETGYDINSQSIQKAPAANGRTALETQADWILRTSLLYAKSGIQRVFYYELYDDNINNPTKYASSGLVNADRTKRPAAAFLAQTNKLFGNYTYAETDNNDPEVDRYTFNGRSMYVLINATEKGGAAIYMLHLGKGDTAFIYQPKEGSDSMNATERTTVNGNVEITVTQTPVFVTGYNVYQIITH
jgi:endoglucanase